MNTIIDFSTAKLLKEKGFYEKCNSAWFEDFGELKNDTYPSLGTWSFVSYQQYNNSLDYAISAPTIAEVVMWLYETHKTWIHIEIGMSGNFNYVIKKQNVANQKWELIEFSNDYTTIPNAYLEAIKYCLTNLI